MVRNLWQSPSFHRWGIPLIIFLVAFLPRAIYPISRPMVWSERAFNFSDAVLDQDWVRTYQRYHPGVSLMWLSGAGLQVYSILNGGLTMGELLGVEPTRPGALWATLSAAELPLALVIALCIALTYPLIRRLAGRKIALTAGLLIALDPFYITYSKVIHPDGILAAFMLICALFLLVYLRGHGRLNLIFSGLFAGLAFLSKTPSLFLIPYTGLIVTVAKLAPLVTGRATAAWQGRLRQTWQIVRVLLLWLIIAIIVFFALWPAMWVNMLEILENMVDRVIFHTSTPHRNPVFFNGAPTTEDPGLIFYLATMAWKTTLVTLPFVGAAIVFSVIRRRTPEGKVLWALVLYVLFFTLQMGFGQYKQLAYILPVFPALDVIAAIGLVWSAEAVGRLRWARQWQWLPAMLITLLITLQAAIVLFRFPYTGTDYNLLLGGSRVAQHILPLQDHGEGLDLAARYLSDLPHGQDATAMLYKRSAIVFKRDFVGRTTTEIVPWASYRVYYINELMRGLGKEAWREAWLSEQGQEPLLTVDFDGIPYVWVYGELPEEPAKGGPKFDVNASLGEHIWLEQANLNSQTVAPGDILTMVLQWESDGSVEESYTTFNHVISAEGDLVAQQDNIPLQGIRPTTTWRGGESLEDTYRIQLPVNLPLGRYQLMVGMYNTDTLERLPAYSSTGDRQPGDSIVITEILVEEPTVSGQ